VLKIPIKSFESPFVKLRTVLRMSGFKTQSCISI